MSLANLYAELRKQVAEAGSQTNWCARHGISQQYLCDVLNARREPGKSILAAMGWRRVVTYQENKK